MNSLAVTVPYISILSVLEPFSLVLNYWGLMMAWPVTRCSAVPLSKNWKVMFKLQSDTSMINGISSQLRFSWSILGRAAKVLLYS